MCHQVGIWQGSGIGDGHDAWSLAPTDHTDVHCKNEGVRSASASLFSTARLRICHRDIPRIEAGGRHQSMSNSLWTFEKVLLVRNPLFTKLLTVMVLLPGSFISKSLVKSPCASEETVQPAESFVHSLRMPENKF